MIYGLELHPMACGIAKADFWKAMEPCCGDLFNFIKKLQIAEWIETLSGMRHAGAHRKLPVPGAIRQQTDRSRMPKEKILAKIMSEDSDERELLSFPWPNQEMKAVVEDQLVFQRRCENLEEIADHMVLLKDNKRGEYFYSPVISIDFDLEMLTKIMDRFFEAFLNKFDK